MANYMDYSNAQQFAQAIRTAMDAYNGAWKARGSVTFANLPSTLTLAMEGYVYNVSDQFTTDSRFVEGAGTVCAAGTNVAIVNTGTEQSPDMKFDTLGTFIDTSAIDARIDATQADIADEFDATEAYAIGDIVMYNDQLYKFKAAHTAGSAWDATEIDAVTVADLIADVEEDDRIDTVLGDIASTFDPTHTYSLNDYVIYNDQLYQFYANHAPGPWTGTDAYAISVTANMKVLDNRITNVLADIAVEFHTNQGYAIGDVVTHDYAVYKFKTAHTAGDPWSASEVDFVRVTDLIDAAEPDSLTSAQMTALIAIIDGTSSGT